MNATLMNAYYIKYNILQMRWHSDEFQVDPFRWLPYLKNAEVWTLFSIKEEQ